MPRDGCRPGNEYLMSPRIARPRPRHQMIPDQLLYVGERTPVEMQTMEAEEGQIVFHHLGSENGYGFSVFVNGRFQRLATDYTETDDHTIRFHYPLQRGTEVALRFDGQTRSTNPEESGTELEEEFFGRKPDAT